MDSMFKQDGQTGILHTVLPPDTLVLLRFDGTEQVNGLYEFTVEALSADPALDFAMLLGNHMCVELATAEGPRYFDGIVTEAQWIGFEEDGSRYRMTLRPWFWIADRRQNQRIFHQMTVVEILQQLFGEWQARCEAQFELRLQESYPSLEYTVQYQESDFAFASRLMERFGISYHFSHELGAHTMVLTDSTLDFDEVPGGSRPLLRTSGETNEAGEHFWDWSRQRRLTTGTVRMTDYNFKTPAAKMEVDPGGTDATHPLGDIETYQYPGGYLEQGSGRWLADLRTREARSLGQRHYAEGNAVGLSPGMTFTLTGTTPEPAIGEAYLCIEARYTFAGQAYRSGGGAVGEAFRAQYTAVPQTAPFAPLRTTPVPRIHGPQTATVVGEGEIDCDEFGRILVHFPWDLEGAYSMRCRVAQFSAQNGWGAMVLPRIGMEVVVEFIDGDPDKPLVTGCVYNGRNMPPYGLPANKSQSGFVSKTHEGSGANQLRFEDQADRQEVYLHAEKDLTTVAKNNESHTIGNNRTKSIGNNQTETVGNNHTETIGNNATISIGTNRTETVGVNSTTKVGAAYSLTVGATSVVSVGGAAAENVGGIKAVTVGGAHQEAVGGARTEQTGGVKSEIVGGSLSTMVGKKISTSAGKEYILEAGDSILGKTKKHTLMAGDKFVISGPGGKITIAASGITIEAKTLKFKAMKIDFMSGSAQAAALKTNKPLAEDCGS